VKISNLGDDMMPNCSTCSIFYEYFSNVPGDVKGDPKMDCPFLKLIEI